jgi:large subunit ribosomal protein L15
MQLNTLARIHKDYRSTVVGRGGKRGKTSGRGGKGQTARAGHKIRPEARDLIKKIPKRRGHGKNRARTVRSERVVYMPVNLALIEHHFAAGETVSPATLLAKHLVRAQKGRAPKVKILGVGEMTKALVLSRVALSASAKAAIEKAGGTINA